MCHVHNNVYCLDFSFPRTQTIPWSVAPAPPRCVCSALEVGPIRQAQQDSGQDTCSPSTPRRDNQATGRGGS